VQEAIDLTGLAFDLADQYRAIAVVLLDGSLGQMMEPAELPPMQPVRTSSPSWATTGAKGRTPNTLSSIYLNPPDEEKANLRLLQRWQQIEAKEVRYKEYFLEDAQYVVVGFGSAGRVALSAVRAARAEGIKVGLLRPITVSPFPTKVIEQLAHQADAVLVVEMNSGQMLEDVRLAVAGSIPVEFYGRLGGVMPFPDEVLGEIHSLAQGNFTLIGHPRDRWLKHMVNVN
jgi:2-oxoglutarate/2-oxoacid ferredoxin oxidoreductase subunit alpha